MILLVVDTSSICQSAILDKKTLLSTYSIISTKDHVEQISKCVQKVIKCANTKTPDAIVVGLGPGPFTGLRVGIAFAETMGFSLGIPVYGIMSHYGFVNIKKGKYITLSDARRKEVYWCQFYNNTLIKGPNVGEYDKLPNLPNIGWNSDPQYVNVGNLGMYAYDCLTKGINLESLAPYYIREADAKIPNLKKINQWNNMESK